MYRIIGADGKEYGPVPLEQVRQWIADGRVMAQTLVQADGTGLWKPLAQCPELTVPPPVPSQRAEQPVGWLRRHFRRHEQRSPGGFLWRVTLEQCLVITVVGMLGALLEVRNRNIPRAELGEFLLTAVFLAPVLETLLLQMLPIGIARVCGAGRGGQVAVSLVVFAVPHFLVSPLTGLTAGLVGGFYFAFTYTHWRRQSLARAFGMTFAQHTLYNAVVAVIVVAGLLAG